MFVKYIGNAHEFYDHVERYDQTPHITSEYLNLFFVRFDLYLTL